MIIKLTDLPAVAARALATQPPSVLIKRYDQVRLYENRCPHLGIRLEWQPNQFFDRDEAHIQCSHHGALFEIDSGLCVYGPCRAQSLTPLPFELIDGTVIIHSDAS